MTYDNANFDENNIALVEPSLTFDSIIELYENDEYITTLAVDTILEQLQLILEEDLDENTNIDYGDDWTKVVALKIAAAVLRNWVDEKHPPF